MPNILIVDDSWLTRRGLKRILSSNGYGVIEAENGLQAIEMIMSREQPLDAIILDLLMPEMGGMELLEKLTSQNITLPVLVLTADIQHTVKKKCIERGAIGFMSKPPDPEELLATLSGLFDKSHGN